MVSLFLLGGMYCGHGNKLVWRIKSSCTGSYHEHCYIPENSNIKTLGIVKNNLSFQKSQWKSYDLRTPNLAPPTFQKKSFKLCFLTVTNESDWLKEKVGQPD